MSAALLERRVLGAVRFLDGTTRLPVTDPLDVRADGVRWIRNRRGYHVVADAPRLGHHTRAFVQPPADVELGSVAVELTVRDPAGRYVTRRRTIYLPRDPDPGNVPTKPVPVPDFEPARDARIGSLFVPIDVVLFPAPSAPVGPGWAVLRGTVTGRNSGEGFLAGALVRVVRTSDDKHLGSGLSDTRGEVLIAVAGVPVTTWTQGEGPVVTTGVDVRLEVVHDPAAAGGVPDPYDLEKQRTSLSVRTRSATLVSGREAVVAL